MTEAGIIEGMGMAWRYLEILIEPSSATVIAAIREHPEIFAGRNVGVIFTGGNVDAADFPQFATGDDD